MKLCVLIPCFNHAATVAEVARAARGHLPVIVVDDGSTAPLPSLPDCDLVRLEKNSGKGAALRAGFKRAAELGYTHAITMDADGQHFAEDLPAILRAATENENALIVGVRDFYAAGAPAGRRRSNAVSTFWYRVESGIRLGDTQCGFRCYPLALVKQLKIRTGRYAFELEFLVRAAWVGAHVIPAPVRCVYQPEQLRHSHFRPVLDLAHITLMNIGLVLQSWFVPQPLRMAWSRGEKKSFRELGREFFADQAGDPKRMAMAIGLGLFFGIAPFWGYQMIAAATVAHFLKLNKAITILASNISIPPMMPFIFYGALAFGHWMFTGQGLHVSMDQMTRARAMEYLGQWIVGSFALASVVAVIGMVFTYFLAVLWRKE